MLTTCPILCVKSAVWGAPVVDGREHRPDEKDKTVRVLMVGAAGLRREVGKVPADLAYPQVPSDELGEHGVLGVSWPIHGRDTSHVSG